MRVLFADDQILPDNMWDSKNFYDEVRARYPWKKLSDAEIETFPIMRQARREVSEGNNVTVARTVEEAMSLARTEEFDVAIIDLGWYFDRDVPKEEWHKAGWDIANALDEADRRKAGRQRTPVIICSARFGEDSSLSAHAAYQGWLPFLKPYESNGDPIVKDPMGYVRSLRAMLTFIERWRAGRESPRDNVNRLFNLLLTTADDGVARAKNREGQWHVVSLTLATIGALIVLTGVASMFLFSFQQAAATAAVGIVLAIIPRLLFGELHRAQNEIQTATKNLKDLVQQAQAQLGQSPQE